MQHNQRLPQRIPQILYQLRLEAIQLQIQLNLVQSILLVQITHRQQLLWVELSMIILFSLFSSNPFASYNSTAFQKPSTTPAPKKRKSRCK